jgi:hypothetical protein
LRNTVLGGGAAEWFAGPALAASAADTATRMLALAGLAIALASNVLQSQIEVLVVGGATATTCSALNGGGSVQQISRKKVSKTEVDADVTVFYDAACATPYIQAKAVFTKGGASTTDIAETATYLGLKGQTLGAMALNESATFAKSYVAVIGLGQFTPSNGAPVVDLGLECTLSSTVAKAHCQGGIAQPFPKLNLSLASVTPLTLKLTSVGGAKKVTFSGAKPNRETGTLGSLSIIESSKTALGIGGAGTAYGPAVTTGTAANFVLFPPTPTHWAITDKAHTARFALKVDSNTTRNSSGSIVDTATGSVLAKIAVDQSGTGKISYTGEAAEAITGWLLAD